MEATMRIDPKATAVDLSRAAKQWQALGEAKITAGRNKGDPDGPRRLSCLLDAVGPLRKSQALWIETGKLLREVGGSNERSAAVADQQAGVCDRQIGFCGESFHELVMERAFDKQRPPTLVETRIAAFEFERNADNRPIEWLIAQFLKDPALGRRASWGDDLDLWWFGQPPNS
jgi:hypothetical protein